MLAKNARTSVEMLQRFYLSKLEAAQFTADLHAQKASKRQRRERTTFIAPPQPLDDLHSRLERARLPKGVADRRLKIVGDKVVIDEEG